PRLYSQLARAAVRGAAGVSARAVAGQPENAFGGDGEQDLLGAARDGQAAGEQEFGDLGGLLRAEGAGGLHRELGHRLPVAYADQLAHAAQRARVTAGQHGQRRALLEQLAADLLGDETAEPVGVQLGARTAARQFGDQLFQRAADTLAAHGDPLGRQRRASDLPAVVQRADQTVVGHEDVVEEDLAEAGLTGDLHQRAHLEAGAAHVDQEVADAFVLGRVLVGTGQAQAPVGAIAQRGPHLLAAQLPAALHPGGGGAQRGEIRARLGFAEQLAPDHLAAQRRPGEALDLFL